MIGENFESLGLLFMHLRRNECIPYQIKYNIVDMSLFYFFPITININCIQKN